ncbi:dethiobiotin synthase [Leptospira perolatii]|uniref:ATP-dependent dethiobiotin synthetase BioD n=1 Tax=Leptospira perolatii TaxID=2023191 RepID=A0A2M9ZJU5_9LEPT|nr:dethiobiotin synthase [Leptospira perolatii]PJZ68589.1 dethiobiotin synthase [Leptospira perolatii]PJZ72244.1 dethiobiotin synthase [Leptospira perolatii]
MAIFVTGTGTDVGKTFFCALFMAKYAAKMGIKYFKPIQTGEDSDRVHVMNLTGLNEKYFLKNYYTFDVPASPLLASTLAGVEIDTEELTRHLYSIRSEKILVEAAGGLYVPLKKSYYNLELISQSEIPTVLVASTKLGTINHTLLSFEALKKASIQCLGVYFIGPENPLRSDSIQTVLDATGMNLLGTFLLPEYRLSRQEFLEKVAGEFDLKEILPKLLSP